MKKVAVFGKPGGGKSTFSKKLAKSRKLKLYGKNGERVAQDVFEREHVIILESENWIIDGFGDLDSFYKRLAYADTLIYIDLPYFVHYWWVTKRMLKSLFVKPEGWPEDSSVLSGTIQCYKTLRMCPKFWNKNFDKKLQAIAENKSLVVIQSVSGLNQFLSDSLHE